MSLFTAVALSASVSFLLTPLARRMAWRVGALDRADGARKLQGQPIPHLGGLAVYAALVAGAGYAWHAIPHSPLALSLLASGALMCLVGWYDDRFALRVRWKLLGQIAATLPLIIAGQTLTRLECCGWGVELGWCGLPLTMAWLVAGANALNFLDGLDGLAAAVGLSVAAMTGAIACRVGDPQLLLLAAVLTGALAGFLKFNWHPATIYLGDAGSMTIGLWLAALSLAAAQCGAGGTRLIVPLALLAVPLTDVGLAVIRRMLAGRAFWLPDRGHIHHRLADRAWSVGKVVRVLTAISGASGLMSFAAVVGASESLVWGAMAIGTVGLTRFNIIGGHEIELVGRWLAGCWHAVDNRASWQRRLKTSQAAQDPQSTG